MFDVHGSEESKIVFEREKVWGMSAIPKGGKLLSYHAQEEDITALCDLLRASPQDNTKRAAAATSSHRRPSRVFASPFQLIVTCLAL